MRTKYPFSFFFCLPETRHECETGFGFHYSSRFINKSPASQPIPKYEYISYHFENKRTSRTQNDIYTIVYL